MSVHTPGPWAVAPKSSHFAVVAQCGVIVTRMSWYLSAREGCQGIDESRANAALIAAAPELLAALQACYDLIAEEVADGEYTEQAKKARAVIEKATGGTPA